jgi:uncharacterized membrane protein YkoI
MRRSHTWVLAALGASAIAIAALPVLAQSKPPEKASKEKAVVQAMEENKITLSRAIEVAEENSKGKAIGARASLDRDKLSFTVQCVVEDKLEVVRIDGKTGKPMAPGRKDAPKDDPKGEKKPKAPEPPDRPVQP